jgi:hypothetical protein
MHPVWNGAGRVRSGAVEAVHESGRERGGETEPQKLAALGDTRLHCTDEQLREAQPDGRSRHLIARQK